MIAYPIKFEPILKEKIWGGTKLKSLLNKDSDKENIGESWEVSAVKNDVSIVANGVYKGQSLQDLLSQFKSELVGKKVFEQFGMQFPLLIKFIDAKEALSIQLHPDDVLAQKRHQSFGKTEMWYVIQADDDANLIVGFKQDCNKETYVKYLESNKIIELLNIEKVAEGDVFFIPTGRIHAIGAGVLLAEIQQTSDITYRIFDWNRVDDAGNRRELHTNLALEAIDYKAKANYKSDYQLVLNQTKTVATCPYFTTNILPILGTISKDYITNDSFVIYICTKGCVYLNYGDNQCETITFGESVLLPNSLKNITLKADEASNLLEVLIKK